MSGTSQLPPRRFDFDEEVQVPTHGSACLGRIIGHEPGSGLREPVEGWAYHLKLLGDTLRERVVIVAEGALRKLTEDAESGENKP